MEKTKVLYLIADVAGGHLSPAVATKQALESEYPNSYDIETVDLYVEADVAPFNTSEESYLLFTRNYTLDRINNAFILLTNTDIGFYLFRTYTLSRLYEATLRLIYLHNADIVITNHPIVTLVLEEVKANHPALFFSVAQITDAKKFFRGSADRFADMTIAPTEEAKLRIAKWGVDPIRIVSPFFPLREQLAKKPQTKKLKSELGIDSSRPVILFTGGGLGTMALNDGIKVLLEEPYEIIVLAGKKDSARRRLQRRYKKYENVHIVGFVDNMQDYYALADVVIAKPGMSTIMECDALQKKCILTRTQGLQEIGNVEYALNSDRYKFVGTSWQKLPALVQDLLTEGEIPTEKGRRLDEAKDIARLIHKNYQTWKGRSLATS